MLLDVRPASTARVLFKAHPQPAEDQLSIRPSWQQPGSRGPRSARRRASLHPRLRRRRRFQTRAPGIPRCRKAHGLYLVDEPVEQLRARPDPVSPGAWGARAWPVAATAPRRHRARRCPAPQDARALVTRYLGPIDGKAAERSWNVLERLVATAEPARVPGRGLRAAAALAAGIAAATWTAATFLTPLSYSGYRLLARPAEVPSWPGPTSKRSSPARRGRAVQRLMAASTR